LLDRLVREIAAGTGPRDTFILYAAAHGYSQDGNYFLIPQDYRGGNNPDALEACDHPRAPSGLDRQPDQGEEGVDPARYLRIRRADERPNQVPYRCASLRIRRWTPARSDRRPVPTATAAGKPAFEGCKGHGVFTYAAIEALRKGDGNGKIELTELAAHIQRRVPELVAELGEHGGVVKGAPVFAVRGAVGAGQSVHFGATGEDFAVVARLP
jgi:hypothetical protein